MISDDASLVAFLQSRGLAGSAAILTSLKIEERRRLERLCTGDTPIEGKTFDSEISLFFEKCPEWITRENQEKVALFWERYPTLEHLKVLRVQRSKLCSIHAGVVLQHYLVAIANVTKRNTENVGMLDIAKYKAQTLSGEQLLKFVKDEFSVPALLFFRDILCRLKRSDIESITIPSMLQSFPPTSAFHQALCESVMEAIEQYPALVTNFIVTEELKNTSWVSYPEIPRDSAAYVAERLHAMVLIGMRKTNDGKYFLLLQNWWPSKPFLEVSSEFFASCGGIIHFVTPSKIPSMTMNHPTEVCTFHSAVETDCDVGENAGDDFLKTF
jgi:hypothetical protein